MLYSKFILLSAVIFSVLALLSSNQILAASAATSQGYDGTKAVVSIQFEQAEEGQYKAIAANMTDMNGSLGVVVQHIGYGSFFMNATQIKQLQNKGWDVASSSETYAIINSTTPASVLQNEIVQSKADLQNKGFTNIRCYVPPYRYVTNSSLPYIANNYECSEVLQYSANSNFLVFPYTFNTLDSLGLSKQKFGIPMIVTQDVGVLHPISNLVQAQQAINTAVANKAWLNLRFYEIDNTGQISST